ncbi:MAG TPA: metalloregulator ArsR/SmtB family transcription factor, partial [Syntrophomonas sp.]|nr:metalloregulator ArsR/SmtB family transcription factor [Syntrophomonas sp.]
LIKIFEEYWGKVFGSEWKTIKQHLTNTIEEQKKVASRTNMLEYILKLHSGMEIINQKLRMKKEVNYEMNLEDISSVHIFPSVFTGPHLMMDIRDTELVLYYNLDFYSITMAKDIPEDIMDIMKVLGDESRVKILKILWQGSATTQSISQILKLAPSTISVHLKLLKRANLVKSEQVKKFVYYEANKELLEETWTKLNQYLND